MRLKLKYDKLLSSFAFKSNLRRYTKEQTAAMEAVGTELVKAKTGLVDGEAREARAAEAHAKQGALVAAEFRQQSREAAGRVVAEGRILGASNGTLTLMSEMDAQRAAHRAIEDSSWAALVRDSTVTHAAMVSTNVSSREMDARSDQAATEIMRGLRAMTASLSDDTEEQDGKAIHSE